MTVPTAPVAGGSLIAGYLAARESGVRPLGGVVIGAAAIYLTRRWNEEAGTGAAVALLGTYLAAFGASHPLAKRIGAWPSVFTVSIVAAGASSLWGDRRRAARR